jgi:uncharacterized membrane protein YjjP (DUF1212 family)
MGTTIAITHKISAGNGMTLLGQTTHSHTNLKKVSVHVHTISTKICTEQTKIDTIYTFNTWIHETIIR